MVGRAQTLDILTLVAGLALATAPDVAAQALIVDGNCRDGQPHGFYQLRNANAQVLVVGAFNKGKRTGSFLFWSSDGSRLAQLPFEGGTLSGTLALWYPAIGNKASRPKLEAVFVDHRLSGIKRSWHPNGALRTEVRYEKGSLLEARAFSETGTALPVQDARELARRDEGDHRAYIGSLEGIVLANLPKCGPGADRPEKS